MLFYPITTSRNRKLSINWFEFSTSKIFYHINQFENLHGGVQKGTETAWLSHIGTSYHLDRGNNLSASCHHHVTHIKRLPLTMYFVIWGLSQFLNSLQKSAILKEFFNFIILNTNTSNTIQTPKYCWYQSNLGLDFLFKLVSSYIGRSFYILLVKNHELYKSLNLLEKTNPSFSVIDW